MGDRKEAGGGWGSADHLLQPFRLLLAAAGQELDDDGQQHHQQFSHGGRLVAEISSARGFALLDPSCDVRSCSMMP